MQPKINAKPQADGTINVDDIVAKTRAAVSPNLQAIYDKAVLSGMRIMFDKSSHKMALAELDKEGPMAQKLANGIISLMYLLWTKSNQTLPPQIIVPVTLTLTLRAFQFLQLSQDPEATKETLGEATADAVQGVMDRFGVTEDDMQKVRGQSNQQPAKGGMLSAGGK